MLVVTHVTKNMYTYLIQMGKNRNKNVIVRILHKYRLGIKIYPLGRRFLTVKLLKCHLLFIWQFSLAV